MMKKTLALILVAFFAACAPGAIGDGVEDDAPSADDPGQDDPPGTPGGGGGGGEDQPEDPGLCESDGTDGSVCEVTADCDAPTVCVNGFCVGPQDPDFRCDPVEGIFCTGADEVCVAGVCVIDPGVPGDGECARPGPGPDLTAIWKMRSTLHLREGLPGLAEGVLDISEVLAMFVTGDIDLGLPGFVEAVIGAIAASIIDEYVPNWAQELVLILAGFSDVLDDLEIDQTVWLDGQPCDANYRGSSRWDWITFEYRGTVITERPENIAEIGPVEPEDFGARYSCGYLYIDRHRVHNALSGLIRWMLDTVVEITTGYPTVESAIDAAINCNAIASALNDAWQSACGCSTNITAGIAATCEGYKDDMLAELTRLIDEAMIELSVVTLQGIATIPDSGEQMLDGDWYGELFSRDFPGEFSANAL